MALAFFEGTEAATKSMWEIVTEGTGNFIDGVLGPTMKICSESEICLLFLSVTVFGLGVRGVSKIIRAFGRGR